MSDPVSYRVSMEKPHSHLFEVVAHFPPCGDAPVLSLPVWTPGSYLVREYARHVQELQALTINDQPLRFERVNKRSVRVEAAGKAFRLRYKVYANELTVRTSHLDGSHGYFNGATLFFYSEELRGREHRVAVHPPDGWRVTTALENQGMDYIAADYDELVDSPFEVGPHTPLHFTAAGVPHEVVIWGDPQLDKDKLLNDLSRIVETEARFFDGLPMKRYVFLIYATDKGRGGLEHKASTALLFPRSGFTSQKGWEDFLTLATHEYFHLWNVKRIKPRALVPFNYGEENYTRLLWAFEGGTSYYDNLLVRRAGLMSPSRYLVRLGESFTALHTTPGRKVLPLGDASLLSWVKHYRPDENTPNSGISYYLKGEIVCALLDLTIRRATADQKSFDDVLRLLWQRYGDESGVPEDGVENAACEVGGTQVKEFLQKAIHQTDDLDYGVFAHVGLEARFRVRESPTDKGGAPPRSKPGEDKPKGWLGVIPRGGNALASVLDGSPAMQAGIYNDDEVVALDGVKCDANGLVSRTEEKKPGDAITVTVFRRDRLQEVKITLGQKPADAVYFVKVDKPTEAQRAAFKSWLGASFDDLEVKT
jgi:predicted metalloprotease with PDZ domain